MAYKYSVPVRVADENTIESIEDEIEKYIGFRKRVDEILSSDSSSEIRIKSEVLRILGLPSKINIGYDIKTHDSGEIYAMPIDLEDFCADIT